MVLTMGSTLVGNVLSRTDNRGVVTTNTPYDALNRVKQTTYSDGVPPTATFSYDAAGANSTGQLTGFSNGTSVTAFSNFDVMGNVQASSQQTAGQTYTFSSYSYNLAGALTSETYPTGRVVYMSYDEANRPRSVSGVINGQTTNYATNIGYAPHGGLTGFAMANGVVPGYSYNNRLQPSTSWATIAYSPSAYLFAAFPEWGHN